MLALAVPLVEIQPSPQLHRMAVAVVALETLEQARAVKQEVLVVVAVEEM